MTKLVGSLALAGISAALILTLSLGRGVAQQSASYAQSGQLHLLKDCALPSSPPPYMGLAGDHCTIVSHTTPSGTSSSNLAEIIPYGTEVFYDQAYGTPFPPKGGPGGGPPNYLGMLDSNIVLYVGVGDWAVGRATLNPGGNSGLMTYSDGVGQLAGFTARAKVSWLGPNYGDGAVYALDGTYSFTPWPPQ